MAQINNTTSYPEATAPLSSDSILIGSLASGVTNNFQLSDIATFVMSANTLTLQDVCDNGSSTTTGITVAGTTTLNGTADISGNTTIGGTLGVTGVSTLGEIDASGVADIADTLTLSKATGTGLRVLADGQMDGDLNVDGEASAASLVSNSIQSLGNLIFNNAAGLERLRLTAAGEFVFQGDASFAGKFILSAGAPSSASDTGTKDEIAIDADYIYICTATDTWKRVAIATW
jgi:hypothetical protein